MINGEFYNIDLKQTDAKRSRIHYDSICGFNSLTQIVADRMHGYETCVANFNSAQFNEVDNLAACRFFKISPCNQQSEVLFTFYSSEKLKY